MIVILFLLLLVVGVVGWFVEEMNKPIDPNNLPKIKSGRHPATPFKFSKGRSRKSMSLFKIIERERRKYGD